MNSIRGRLQRLATSLTDDPLRSQLLWMIILRMVLYTLLLVIVHYLRADRFALVLVPGNLLSLLLLGVFLFSLSSASLLLVYRGSLRKFGFLQNLFDTFFAAVLVFLSGSSQSIFTSLFFFPIVAGGLILPRKGGLLAAAASTLQLGLLLALEAAQMLPRYLAAYLELEPAEPSLLLNHFAVQGLVFFLAGLLSALFGLRLQRAESALTDSRRRFDELSELYKQIFDNISTGILTLDSREYITSANNALAEITGLAPQEIRGKNVRNFFPHLDLEGQDKRLTADFTRPDGVNTRIGYSSMAIMQPPGPKDVGGRTSSKIVTMRDITTLERLEKQVRQNEKLAAIGMMSASIAHDFRNPLAAISGSAQVLAKEFSGGSAENYSNFELANIILRESNRLTETISDFLKFSRPDHANCQWFSLRSCLNEAVQVCQADLNWPQSCVIRYDFDQNLDIWADERQMFTVFVHLITNSLPFCPLGKEEITFSAREAVADNRECVIIACRDNGSGIPPGLIDQIFEPFFTSRPDGTGLGLAIIQQTLLSHQGTVSAANIPGGGAEFTLTLPLPA